MTNHGSARIKWPIWNQRLGKRCFFKFRCLFVGYKTQPKIFMQNPEKVTNDIRKSAQVEFKSLQITNRPVLPVKVSIKWLHITYHYNSAFLFSKMHNHIHNMITGSSIIGIIQPFNRSNINYVNNSTFFLKISEQLRHLTSELPCFHHLLLPEKY